MCVCVCVYEAFGSHVSGCLEFALFELDFLCAHAECKLVTSDEYAYNIWGSLTILCAENECKRLRCFMFLLVNSSVNVVCVFVKRYTRSTCDEHINVVGNRNDAVKIMIYYFLVYTTETSWFFVLTFRTK